MRSRTDSLTGVFNRRHFHEVLDAELARAERDRSTPGVLVVDIDHFKRVNDSFGHQVGDEVLVEVANRIAMVLRSYDSIARWGGEEFVVLAPAVPDEARPRAASASSCGAPSAAGRSSPPAARSPSPPRSAPPAPSGHLGGADELIDAADQALYVAKRRGRNRVCLFTDVTRRRPGRASSRRSCAWRRRCRSPSASGRAPAPTTRSRTPSRSPSWRRGRDAARAAGLERAAVPHRRLAARPRQGRAARRAAREARPAGRGRAGADADASRRRRAARAPHRRPRGRRADPPPPPRALRRPAAIPTGCAAVRSRSRRASSAPPRRTRR